MQQTEVMQPNYVNMILKSNKPEQQNGLPAKLSLYLPSPTNEEGAFGGG